MLKELFQAGSTREGKDRAKIYKTFPRMSERKNQLAGTLSGGEQQMLAMGRALIKSHFFSNFFI